VHQEDVAAAHQRPALADLHGLHGRADGFAYCHSRPPTVRSTTPGGRDDTCVPGVWPAVRISSGQTGTGCGAGGPTYCAAGRMIRRSVDCSRTFAAQPTTRLTANVGVNMSRGIPQSSITTPAKNSTLV